MRTRFARASIQINQSYPFGIAPPDPTHVSTQLLAQAEKHLCFSLALRIYGLGARSCSLLMNRDMKLPRLVTRYQAWNAKRAAWVDVIIF